MMRCVNQSVTGWAMLAVMALGLAPRAHAEIGFEIGPLSVGGAMRVNYVIADQDAPEDGSLGRGSSEGNFELDTFRINLGLSHEGIIGAAEYRWYDGYSFVHTGWLGYEDPEWGRIEAGVSRAPFGVGPYGPANSFFFDQHYYVGLADTMKVGLKYSHAAGPLSFDLAYYPMDVPNGRGAGDESVRYSYAVVPEDAGDTPGAYEERHQINARLIYTLEDLNTDVGVSAKYSQLNAQDDRASNSDAYAVSVHSSTSYNGWNLMTQLTSYRFDADYSVDAEGNQPSNDLIVMGAFGFPFPVASEGIIPSVALSYTITPDTDLVDSITFYNDYSIIVKDGEVDGQSFRDSQLNVTGMAIAKGGWYIQTDYALSDGNYFIGPDGDFGSNFNDDWNYRFNINFGYYF